jgi:hypothetical protein
MWVAFFAVGTTFLNNIWMSHAMKKNGGVEVQLYAF